MAPQPPVRKPDVLLHSLLGAVLGAVRCARVFELGAMRFMELENFVVWASGAPAGLLAVTKPFDGKPANVGNGVMVALAARSREQVDTIYRKAIELGATDEGTPGPPPVRGSRSRGSVTVVAPSAERTAAQQGAARPQGTSPCGWTQLGHRAG